MQTEMIFEAHALLAEGPVWIPEQKRLYWLDIESKFLHRLDPETQIDERFELSNKVGCFVPCENDKLLLASQSGIEEICLKNGQVEILRTLAHPEANKPSNRYNDGKCSPEGRFWFGSLNMEKQTGQASLYVLDDQGCRTVLTGATNSNGLGWSPDGTTFYWIDTPTRRIEAFDYNMKTGNLSNRRIAFVFPEDLSVGKPDGMTVDADGMVWIAHWMGGRVSRWNPTNGEILDEIRLPVSRVSCPTFGGSDLKTLFITTASKEMTPKERQAEPYAGCLFAVKTKIGGLPVSKFKFL